MADAQHKTPAIDLAANTLASAFGPWNGDRRIVGPDDRVVWFGAGPMDVSHERGQTQEVRMFTMGVRDWDGTTHAFDVLIKQVGQ